MLFNGVSIGIVLLLAFAIGLGAAVSRYRRPTGPVPPTERLPVGLAALWMLPVLLGFGYLCYLHSDVWKPFDDSRSLTYQPGDVTLPTSPGNRIVDSTAEGELPAWVALGQNANGNRLTLPIHSDLQSTEEAARHIAQSHALEIVRREVQLAYPNADLSIELPDLKSLLVLDETALETRPTDLGPVETSMYRAHTLMHVDDEVRARVLEISRKHSADEKILQLVILAGLLTVIWMASAACFRLDLRTESRYRGWLQTALYVVVLAGALLAHFGLSVIEQGLLISTLS